MSDIKRIDGAKLMSGAVVHNGIAYTSGLTATNLDGDAAAQTKEILTLIDAALEKAGTDKTKLIKAQIWLKDIGQDFSAMNEVWAHWLAADCAPVRVTCEANLAAPDVRVEIMVTAAV